MKYISLAFKYISLIFKTVIAVIVAFFVITFLVLYKDAKEEYDRDTQMIDPNRKISFDELCEFTENNLDELLEFSDNYLSMLTHENAAGHSIDIEAEGDMQEFRDKLFDHVYEGHAFINGCGDKSVVFRSDKGDFTESIVIYGEGNCQSAKFNRDLSVEKDFRDRVFVLSLDSTERH